MLYTTEYASPIGPLTLASDGEGITGLWMHGQKYYAATLRGRVEEKNDLPIFTKVKEWLDAYFDGKNPAIADLPLSPGGSPFRKAVWDLLCEIPYGQCTTYGDIARKLATAMNKKSMSSQAVGGAVGQNPISIIIPCHRVVGSNGSLTGYAGGIAKKITLLELEGVTTANYFVPTKGTAL